MEDDYYLKLEPFNILYSQIGSAFETVAPWIVSGILLGIVVMIIVSKLPFEVDSIPENVENSDTYEEINKNANLNNQEMGNTEINISDSIKNSVPSEQQKKLKKMLKKAGVRKTFNPNQSFDNGFHMFSKADMVVIMILLSILVGVIYKDYGISPFSKIISFFSRELDIINRILKGG